MFKKFFYLPKELFQNKELILQLSKNDFRKKFAGSYLGIIWAFIQPVVTVIVYWFVFAKALNQGTVGLKEGITAPFVIWLIAGLVPWFFFSDALSGAVNAFIEYSYLVKKVVFKISILPVIKIISALFVHLFFILFTIVFFSFFKFYPTIYTVQVLYYSLCMFLLVLGISYITSAVSIFFRDLIQIINIILQVGVWATPIMWNIAALEQNAPRILIFILKMNPMYYIVSGYRDSLIEKVWFWEHPAQSLYFLGWIVIMFVIGIVVFKRLKPHFSDVL